MPEFPYMTEEAKLSLGREEVDVSDPVSLRQIKEYVAATDDWGNPHYTDPGLAAQTAYGEIVAPPLFYEAPLRRVVPESRLQEDGQYDDLAVPGIYGRSMAGGTEVEVFRLVRVGDVITKRAKVIEIQEKEGRTGRLIFQTTESRFTNQDEDLLAIEKRTLIFR